MSSWLQSQDCVSKFVLHCFNYMRWVSSHYMTLSNPSLCRAHLFQMYMHKPQFIRNSTNKYCIFICILQPLYAPLFIRVTILDIKSCNKTLYFTAGFLKKGLFRNQEYCSRFYAYNRQIALVNGSLLISNMAYVKIDYLFIKLMQNSEWFKGQLCMSSEEGQIRNSQTY